ncbi:MAG: hypothetical protein SGBAC_003144 [Bacillariaceae sp.]
MIMSSATPENRDIVRGRVGNLAKTHVGNRYFYDVFLPRYRNEYARSTKRGEKRALAKQMLVTLEADGFRFVKRDKELWIQIKKVKTKVAMIMHCMRDRLLKGLFNDAPQPVEAENRPEDRPKDRPGDRPEDRPEDRPQAVGLAFDPNLQPLPVLFYAQVENRKNREHIEDLRAYDSHRHLRGNHHDQQIADPAATVAPIFQAPQRHQTDVISRISNSSLILPPVNPALLPSQKVDPVEVNNEPLQNQGEIDSVCALGSREFSAPFDAVLHFPDNDQQLADNDAGSYSAVFQEDVASIFDDPDFDPLEIPPDDTEVILDNDKELLVECFAALCDADQHFHDA